MSQEGPLSVGVVADDFATAAKAEFPKFNETQVKIGKDISWLSNLLFQNVPKCIVLRSFHRFQRIYAIVSNWAPWHLQDVSLS